MDNCRVIVYFQVANHSETSALPVLKSVIKKAVKPRTLVESRVRRAEDLPGSIVGQR